MAILTTFGSASARNYGIFGNATILISFTTTKTWISSALPSSVSGVYPTGAGITAISVNGATMALDTPSAGNFTGYCPGDYISASNPSGVYNVAITIGGTTYTESYYSDYYALAPAVNDTSNLSSTYTVPAGVTQLYIEGSAAGGGGGSSACYGENYTQVGGGGGGGQAFRGTLTVTPGEIITYSIGRQGYAAGWYTYDFGGLYYSPTFSGSNYYNAGNRGKSGSAGANTTVSSSSGSISITANGGSPGGWASGGAGGTGGSVTGTQSGSFALATGSSGSGDRTGGNAGGYGASGYIAPGTGGNAIGYGSNTYWDAGAGMTSGSAPTLSYGGYSCPGVRGGASSSSASAAYSGFGGGGGGGVGYVDGGGGLGCGGPGAPGYLIIKPVG